MLQVTVPIIAVLLLAEITGTLIGEAWLLAPLVGLAGWGFYAGYVARDHVLEDYRYAAQVGFVAVLFLIGTGS